MSIGNLILGSLASAAAKAYTTAAEKKKATATATAAVKPTTNAVTNNSTPSVADNQSYINKTYSGGMDAYTKLQNDRYNEALKNNNVDLLNKLNQDATARGYSLTSNQVVQPVLAQNPYAAQFEQNQAQYDSLLKDYRNVINALVNQGTENFESQKDSINQNSNEMSKQAYILSRQNVKNLPQQLASRGMTGGATETAQLGLITNYENNLNNISTNKNNALNAVDTSINNLKNEGELSYAEQTLANNQAALSAYQNILDKSVNQKNYLNESTNNQNQYEDSQQNYQNETASAAKQQEYNNILNRLSMGLIGPNDAVALGVPAADVQAFVNRINASADLQLKNATTSSKNKTSSGSNSSSGTSLANGVVETANKYLSQGSREKAISALASIMSPAEIKAYFEANGVKTDDIDWGIDTSATNAYAQYVNPTSAPSSMLINWMSSQGMSASQIADRLNGTSN